jgi:hypothetical protein
MNPLEKEVEFFKNRAHDIQAALNARLLKGQDAALKLRLLTRQLEGSAHKLKLLTQQLEGTQFFLKQEEQQSARKDALIADLQKNTKDALVFYADDLGASPKPDAQNANTKNIKRWASTALSSLQKALPNPKQLHCALRSLASTELSAADIGSILEERKDDLAGSTFLQNQIKAGQEDYRDFLQDHLSPAIGENLIKTLMISRRKYVRLNHRLFYKIGENTEGKRVPLRLSFNGVEAPQLPQRRALEKFRRDILEHFELTVEDDGLSTSVNLRKVLKEDVLASIRQGFFVITGGEVKQSDGRHVQVMQYTDTANQFKVENRIKKNKRTYIISLILTYIHHIYIYVVACVRCIPGFPLTCLATHSETRRHLILSYLILSYTILPYRILSYLRVGADHLWHTHSTHTHTHTHKHTHTHTHN